MIDSSLVLPRVRSDIEDQCNKIAKGLAKRVRSSVTCMYLTFASLYSLISTSSAGGRCKEGN